MKLAFWVAETIFSRRNFYYSVFFASALFLFFPIKAYDEGFSDLDVLIKSLFVLLFFSSLGFVVFDISLKLFAFMKNLIKDIKLKRYIMMANEKESAFIKEFFDRDVCQLFFKEPSLIGEFLTEKGVFDRSPQSGGSENYFESGVVYSINKRALKFIQEKFY